MRISGYITGTVIQGLGNGHKFGFPTANVGIPHGKHGSS